MERDATPPRQGGSRRHCPDEIGDPLYRAALAVEQDETLADEMKAATIGDGIFRKAPDRKSR